MSAETQHDPPPLNVGPQQVTVYPDGSWKSVIEQPKDGNSSNGDWELKSRGAENVRRGIFLRRRMGLS